MRFSTPHGHDFFHGHHFTLFGPDFYDELGVHRGWLALLGILYLVLGVLGLGWVTLMTLASVIFFGVLLEIGGIFQLVSSFMSHGWRNVLPGALLGLLYLFAGLVIFYNPLASSLLLTLYLAGALMALGVVRIVYFARHRGNRYWIWSIISGVISIALGVLIVAQWPVTGLWVIGLFVSVEMIFHGAAAVALAIENKRISA